MTSKDLPELSARHIDRRFWYAARLLNDHGFIGVERSKDKASPLKRNILILVEHEERGVTAWLQAATGVGRTYDQRLHGLLLTREERERWRYRWQVRRWQDAKNLISLTWPWLESRLKDHAIAATLEVQKWKALRKMSKRGVMLGRPEMLGPLSLAAPPLPLPWAKPKRPKTGLWFIDDDEEDRRREVEGRSPTAGDQTVQ